ncbi:MAG: Rieske (2Fe-2S) protein, partial [Gammaproteobacteria bacterium]
MSVKGEWLQIAKVKDFEVSKSREYFLEHKDHADWPVSLMLLKKEGEFFCYLNKCPHAGHPLNLERDKFLGPEETDIICRSHGARFSIDTGECFFGPCVDKSLISLEIKVESGCIFLS